MAERRAKGTAVAGGPARKRKAPAAKKPTVKRASVKRSTAKAAAKTAKVADRAAAKARAAGAVGKGNHGLLDRHQRALRDTAIMARVAEGRSSKVIGEEFGLTQRAVDAIRANWRKQPSHLDGEPMEIMEWLTSMHLRQFGDLTAMAAENVQSNPSVALGARKAAGDALLRYTELLSAVGKLPENLELFRAESVLRQMADQMLETMELVVAGDLSPAEAAEVFRRMTGEPAQLAAAA